MAEVTLEGWLSKDAELRFTPSGHPVLNFDVPDNHRKKQGDQWVEDGTTWYRVTYWGSGQAREDELAELSEALKKGARVIVRGDLRMTEREHNGQTYKNLDLTARRVGLIVQPQRNGGNGGGQATAQQQGWSQAQQGHQQADPWAAPQGGGGWGNPPSTNEPPF